MDVAEIQEALTDELKKVQKEEFSGAFQKWYNRTKACIYAKKKKNVPVFQGNLLGTEYEGITFLSNIRPYYTASQLGKSPR